MDSSHITKIIKEHTFKPALTLDFPSSNFTKIYDSKLFSDITLSAIGGKRYPVHRNILANVSEYFMKLFTTTLGNLGTVIPLEIKPEILELYLDLIYKKHITINNWRDVIELLKFIDFTQTTFINLETFLFKININNPQEYPKFFNSIIELYHGELPIEFIHSMDKFEYDILAYLNYKDLGKEFTRTLIESISDSNIKYYIAYKAVTDGLDPSIYRLIQYEAIARDLIRPESEPYLRRINYKLLTYNLGDALNKKGPFTVAITENNITRYHRQENIQEHSIYVTTNPGSIYRMMLRVSREYIDENKPADILIPYHGDKILASKLAHGTIITITKYIFPHLGSTVLIEDFDIIEY